MQVFRLMGLPDKIIAFDELPEELVKGFELIRADGFPKYWKKWMGLMTITTQIPPEVNNLTGTKKTFPDFVEEDSYFYLVDSGVRPDEERWKKIEEYVRNHVSSDFRLTDKLEDMAKPLAPDKVSGITLEPDDVVIIPIPKEAAAAFAKEAEAIMYCCQAEGCDKEFDTKQGLRMHTMKRHTKKEMASV